MALSETKRGGCAVLLAVGVIYGMGAVGERTGFNEIAGKVVNAITYPPRWGAYNGIKWIADRINPGDVPAEIPNFSGFGVEIVPATPTKNPRI